MSQPPRISQLTQSALLFKPGDAVALPQQQRIWQLAGLVRALPQLADTLQEVVPGMGNLMISVKPGREEQLADIADSLPQLWLQTEARAFEGRHVDIPTRYGGEAGPDLPALARHAGLEEAEVIARHSQAEYQVYCLGFQPGFAYLGGLPGGLAMPRRSTPRTQVPAGSVAIGGEHTGIYPASSPAGWHIIGHTALRLFDVSRSPSCLLQPGDTVRFVAVS